MNDQVTRLLAYVMIGMGIGILVKAGGGGIELTIALGVAFVCVFELIKRVFIKDEKK